MMRTILLTILFSSCIFYSYGVTKHALIIAIGNYPASGGWQPLASHRDAEYMQTALQKHGFQDIRLVADKEATMEGILNAFQKLINDAGIGDVVAIHFSCHGEQVATIDKNKLGGLDQCVVTYNAILPKLSSDFNKDQAQYLRGQTIGKYLQQLRAKLGKTGDVVLFMDYCHSGAGTRGIGKKRGGEPPFIPQGYTLSISKFENSDFINKDLLVDRTKLATFVSISATRPEEFDLEITDDNGHEMGSLTYAVSKAFEQLDNNTSYRKLFARIQSIMMEKVPMQHPLIEGNGQERLLFGGNYEVQKAYFEIESIESGNSITIKGGMLSGLDTGAKISVYRAGTANPKEAKEIASGKIVSASAYTSTARLTGTSSIGSAANGWIFVTSPAYRIKSINVSVAEPNKNGRGLYFSTTERTAVLQSLREIPQIQFGGKPELKILKGTRQDSIIYALDGSLIDTISNIAANTERLKQTLLNYAQYKFLKEMSLNDVDISIDVKLVPIINGVLDTSTNNAKNRDGVLKFKNNDQLCLWVKNNSKESVYINVVDMQPNGIINPIFPYRSRNIHPWDLKLAPSEEHMFEKNKITINPPYGTEILKVFVSKDEIDLEGIANNGVANTRGGAVRGNLTGIEKLFKRSSNVAARGEGSITSEGADGKTYDIVFKIVP